MPVACLFALPFVAGRVIASRGASAERLRARNERLEREQGERARQAAGEERIRVARELHDDVAHSVSVMVIHAVAAREVAGQNRHGAREALRTVESCGREALREMRRMVGVLRRGELEPARSTAPGLSHLEAVVNRARASGLPVEVPVKGAPRRLPAGVDSAALRVVQEALTNTIKHAGPARATVLIKYSAAALELEVTDTGRGASLAPSPVLGGNELVGMRERVMQYAGDLQAGAGRGGGFRVSARIPINNTPPEGGAGHMKRSRDQRAAPGALFRRGARRGFVRGG